MSDANRVRIGYAAESVWGTTPASPALQLLRFTNDSLMANAEFSSSNEIRDDRQVSDVVRTNFGAGGDLGIELSYGAFDELFEALLFSDWVLDGGGAGIDTLENGVTSKFFTLEKHFVDINQFIAFRGMMVAGGQISVEPGSFLTGSFSFLGKDAVPASATVGDGSPVAAPTNAVVNAIDHITAFTEGGGAFGGDVLGLNFEVQNNLRARPAVGVLGASSIGVGRIQVSGTFNTYFDSLTEYQKFINGTASSLGFTITDAAGNAYTIEFPRVRYTSGNPDTPGVDQDIVLPLEFTAFLDPVSGVTIRMTRNPA
jgi:hypothetical protein